MQHAIANIYHEDNSGHSDELSQPKKKQNKKKKEQNFNTQCMKM